MERRIAAFFAVALAATSAHAQTAPPPCLLGGSFDAAVAALADGGWTVLTPGMPVPADAAERLGWGLVATYVAADTGGASLAELHDLQRRAVAGLARKVDTETSRARVAIREGAALTISRTTTLPGRVEQVCRIALDGLAARAYPEGFGPVEASRIGDAEVIVQPLDPDTLSLLTERPVAVATLIETRTILTEDEAR
ncbi:hypothetical protein JQC91_02230 [Jannaschia sp. Os4]|uniref:hypothetical protein n=1 Tax=Jannaschia sp. Os4 TaxID=2807617 RepID=UPI00193996B8|nr:hypothetical protein [Jannaschia sp. Os4]MBM2575111.1 hypothetical protein [Jannaschia sp. Os4]